jgi:hypothetical protein
MVFGRILTAWDLPDLARLPGPTPADRRCGAGLVAAVLIYGAMMWALSRASLTSLLQVTADFAIVSAYSVVLVGACYVGVCLLRPQARAGFWRRLFWLLIAGLVVGLSFPFFGMFKQLILHSRGFVWDRAFAHLGIMLLGASPWTFTHAVFGSVAGTRFLDEIYVLWSVVIFAAPLIACVVFNDPRIRFQVLLSWFAAWVIIGTVCAWAFASAGPCYFNTFIGPDANYAELQRRLADIARIAAAQGHHLVSIDAQAMLLKVYASGQLAPGAGISAMPSMHVALAMQVAFTGFARARIWGVLFAIYAVLIWIASIHFGWHYFVDGPVAALLMAAVWKLSGSVASRCYADPGMAQSTPQSDQSTPESGPGPRALAARSL